NSRQGALVLSDGRILNTSANNISIGALGGSNGSITLSGAATQLTTTGTTAVGGSQSAAGGTGLLTINNGATLNTGPLTVWPGGSVVLNGGTLNLTTFGANGGSVAFNS